MGATRTRSVNTVRASVSAIQGERKRGAARLSDVRHAREALRPAHAPTRARTDAGRLNGRRGGRWLHAETHTEFSDLCISCRACLYVCSLWLGGRVYVDAAGARARARIAPDDASAQAAAGQRACALSASLVSVLLRLVNPCRYNGLDEMK